MSNLETEEAQYKNDRKARARWDCESRNLP